MLFKNNTCFQLNVTLNCYFWSQILGDRPILLSVSMEHAEKSNERNCLIKIQNVWLFSKKYYYIHVKMYSIDLPAVL